ncbi:hypothetical protein NEUTE1DRAFT_102672 [Neurospora tetrasperma FGSC 2508]|uniref:Uncharacterized protein n=1 Tax=Neurospora tetrasperma (strain FGSC 2508 / ATCC MYA-4615 / P0657) TaxID=510951 RepID=F8MT99_NEUT8|nr:uncharacterized protein NEUTE1DRAFT_102672 [Neurospora tetrasperma FGSC 2508]EGO55231.1 hypothetical protein NEUTE1DRAFT_102672 [Neurospora tetrasperma FGSC 2508]EGZ69551.1 hypothetical protein NEUTE2DRAFT_71171 [Neurospora tetrasperma FGSC 2509]
MADSGRRRERRSLHSRYPGRCRWSKDGKQHILPGTHPELTPEVTGNKTHPARDPTPGGTLCGDERDRRLVDRSNPDQLQSSIDRDNVNTTCPIIFPTSTVSRGRNSNWASQIVGGMAMDVWKPESGLNRLMGVRCR